MQSCVGSAYYADHVGTAQVVAREGAAASEQSYLMAWPPSLAMCPRRLVNRDGDVSGTKDRDGIDPNSLVEVWALSYWSFKCYSTALESFLHWLKKKRELRWQSILPLPHVIVGKVVEPRSLWAVFKLMSTLVLEHTLCCYQTRYCKLEEARASCEELGRLFALLPRWNAIVIWFLEASILHWVGNCSCHFCFTQALRWERLRELSDYCIVHSLNAYWIIFKPTLVR